MLTDKSEIGTVWRVTDDGQWVGEARVGLLEEAQSKSLEK